jgi:uncharacterized DUF497 family protein
MDATSGHSIFFLELGAMTKPGVGRATTAVSNLLESIDPATQIVSTIKLRRIEFDEAKSARNERERGLPFSMVEAFDFETAHYLPDNRNAYPEMRYVALGFLKASSRLYVLCFTHIPNGIRVISFRKANQRERRFYEKAHTNDTE